MYYLQSRYYDPQVGRFVNGDIPEFALLSMNGIGHNLLSYCFNNPINFTDLNGNIALVDDAAVWAFIGLCTVLMMLISWMSTQEFRRSWASFCAAVGNGLDWIGTGIVNGGRAAWNWTTKQVKAAIAAITAYTVVARADAKIKNKVKKKSKTRYWTATLRVDHVDIGRAISYNTAVKEASQGRNVFTVTSSEAKAVAKAAYSNKKPYGPEIHGGGALGYYYHYHIHGHKKNGHVFFLFW